MHFSVKENKTRPLLELSASPKDNLMTISWHPHTEKDREGEIEPHTWLIDMATNFHTLLSSGRLSHFQSNRGFD